MLILWVDYRMRSEIIWTCHWLVGLERKPLTPEMTWFGSFVNPFSSVLFSIADHFEKSVKINYKYHRKKTGHRKFQQELGMFLAIVTGLQWFHCDIYSTRLPNWENTRNTIRIRNIWRDDVRSYILPPTQAGTLVFTPSVWEPSLEGWRCRVGWLVVHVEVGTLLHGDVWRFLEKKNSRIVLYMEKNQMIFWVEFCCWCCGTMYLGFQWSISILVNVASLLHLAMGSK